MSGDYDPKVLMAETRVARQDELIRLLKARGRDTREASSLLAGLRYSLKVIKQQRERQRRLGTGSRGSAAKESSYR